jgi:hypothetical protein
MAVLHFLENTHEHLIMLCNPIFFLIYPTLIEQVYIFQPLSHLHHPINQKERVWITIPTLSRIIM